MNAFRFAALSLVAGTSLVAATPSSAHRSGAGGFHYGSGMNGGGMSMTPRPMHMNSPMGHSMGGHMSGCCGGGAHMGGGGSHMPYGGRPQPGMHPMGMHFYGMSGNGLMKRYGQMSGGHSYGMWSGGHAYGMGGAHEMHAPLGTHMMGLHFYGMGGGSLAQRYGHLEHGFGQPMRMPVNAGGGLDYGLHNARPPKTWGTPVAHNSYGRPAPIYHPTPEHRYESAGHKSYSYSNSVTYKVTYSSNGHGAGYRGFSRAAALQRQVADRFRSPTPPRQGGALSIAACRRGASDKHRLQHSARTVLDVPPKKMRPTIRLPLELWKRGGTRLYQCREIVDHHRRGDPGRHRSRRRLMGGRLGDRRHHAIAARDQPCPRSGVRPGRLHPPVFLHAGRPATRAHPRLIRGLGPERRLGRKTRLPTALFSLSSY